MAEATLKDIIEFFKTGDHERDRPTNFAKEWKALSDDEKTEVKTLVGAAISS